MGGQGSLTLPSPSSLTPVLWKSDGLPLTQLWLILSDYITRYRSLVGLLKWAHWFLIRTPLNTSWKELGKYILQIRLLLKVSEGMFPHCITGSPTLCIDMTHGWYCTEGLCGSLSNNYVVLIAKWSIFLSSNDSNLNMLLLVWLQFSPLFSTDPTLEYGVFVCQINYL